MVWFYAHWYYFSPVEFCKLFPATCLRFMVVCGCHWNWAGKKNHITASIIFCLTNTWIWLFSIKLALQSPKLRVFGAQTSKLNGWCNEWPYCMAKSLSTVGSLTSQTKVNELQKKKTILHSTNLFWKTGGPKCRFPVPKDGLKGPRDRVMTHFTKNVKHVIQILLSTSGWSSEFR